MKCFLSLCPVYRFFIIELVFLMKKTTAYAFNIIKRFFLHKPGKQHIRFLFTHAFCFQLLFKFLPPFAYTI